ncbi:hypothetical protein LTR56_021677 [Elasticomyces elasticus]|nr:hypothetical protein LTR56_021677 [Elasticomyces elasticus]KAK3664834.1 hypothetical protein LTR22_004424 [Elasticomyces elasticus]KAK4928643.1 hypothetical protein LTR49_004766 [Elasticomyces elasticus]KAK5765213.1 hypothetical protein LTS12_004727 [Elasticomyces elasticus]
MTSMQSSPPMRAWDRPTSPADTQYSLDLGALGLESHDNETSPIPKQHVDRVLSEDIDGPSDFTLNMVGWMKGGTLGKGTARSAKSGLQTWKEQEARQQADDGKDGEHLEVPQSPLEDEHTSATSNHTPDHSPPKDSPWHERPSFREQQQDEVHGNDESEWDPYAPTGTPQVPAHKHFLQPTVEDYNSEFTPARMPSASANAPSLRITTNSAPRSKPASPQHSEPSSPGRPSSETLSPIRSPERSPVLQRSHPARVSSPYTEPERYRELEHQLQQLQERCRQLESLNSALRQALDEEQRVRRQEKAAHEKYMMEARNRESTLTRSRMEASRSVSDLRQEFSEQKERLSALQRQLEKQGQHVEDSERQTENEISKLRDELDTQRENSERHMQEMKLELELAVRGKESSEETARQHREELEDFRDSETAEMEQLRHELQQARSTIVKLEGQAETASVEANCLRSEKDQAEQSARAARDAAAAKQLEHDEQTVKLTTDHSLAVQHADELQQQVTGLQQQLKHNSQTIALTSERKRTLLHTEPLEKQIKGLQQQLKMEQSSHAEELKQAKSDLKRIFTKAAASVDTAKSRLEEQRIKINEAIVERDQARDALEELEGKLRTDESEIRELRTDLETAKATLQNTRAANKGFQQKHVATASASVTFEEKVEEEEKSATPGAATGPVDTSELEALREREAELRAKLAEVQYWSKKKSLTLMHIWGAEEFGVTVPQKYRFTHVKRAPKPPGLAAQRRLVGLEDDVTLLE